MKTFNPPAYIGNGASASLTPLQINLSELAKGDEPRNLFPSPQSDAIG